MLSLRARAWRPLAIALLWSLASCGGPGGQTGGDMPDAILRDIPADAWSALTGQRVFFGHQSVGGNILAGVADLGRARAERAVAVAQLAPGALPAGPGIAHALVGRNGHPQEKMDDFAARLDGGLAANVDIALMKLCYVDIDEGTDVEALFARYRQTLAGLRARHPQVTFVHVTAPLQGPRPGWRSELRQRLKSLLGKGGVTPARNARRERYNELMRQTYAGREPVFDLALLESTLPGGKRATQRVAGAAVPRLAAVYTSDGGHLNDLGRRLAAARLLESLAATAQARAAGRAAD